MSNEAIKWGFRGPSGDDVPFILNSWLKSARDSGDRAAMNNSVYYGGFRDECVKRLNQGFVTIACDVDDPDMIYGWLAGSAKTPAIHYVYVKHPFRKFGVARSLVENAFPTFGTVATTVTTIGRHHKEWARKFNLNFDPYVE